MNWPCARNPSRDSVTTQHGNNKLVILSVLILIGMRRISTHWSKQLSVEILRPRFRMEPQDETTHNPLFPFYHSTLRRKELNCAEVVVSSVRKSETSPRCFSCAPNPRYNEECPHAQPLAALRRGKLRNSET